MLLFYLGLPAMFGSWPVALIMAVTMAVTLARTAREDANLQAHLDGYSAYAGRVRWRIVPRVW